MDGLECVQEGFELCCELNWEPVELVLERGHVLK